MFNNTIMKKIIRIIKNNNITNNELYQIITILNRQYLDTLVKENMLKLIDNSMPYMKNK